VSWKPLFFEGGSYNLCKLLLPSDFNKESFDPTRNPTCDEGRCDYKADYVKCMERGSGLASGAAKS
jgi:hypothetical protein